jgi:hypothetical protein
MADRLTRLSFDSRDHELLAIVNAVCNRDRARRETRQAFYPYFHPQGIKEIAESRGLRIAYAVIRLLDSLEGGEADERLDALRSLRDEAASLASGTLPRNTARVLLQIMKELVRSRGDYERQLRLARDFRMTAAGNPLEVRRQLRRYHLLEMPEEWNQLAFDDHVHDANTKGRKSSTHLIMDAWIKGIRRLRVIYYNYLEPRFAAELLAAAEIMGIMLRIGVEFSARYRDRFVQIIWVPRGFPDAQALLCFLAEAPVVAFMAEGRQVSEYQQRYVFEALAAYNRTHRHTLGDELGLALPAAEEAAFRAFVGTGQASLVHLGEFLHATIQAYAQPVLERQQRDRRASGDPSDVHLTEQAGALRSLDAETLIERFLEPTCNPDIPDPSMPRDDFQTPAMLKLSPHELLHRLHQLHSGYRITLNLSGLHVEEVLELLYTTEGFITRLEIFNLKDYSAGKTQHVKAISQLQQAINSDNLIALKAVILDIIEHVALSDHPDKADRIQVLTAILHDIPTLHAMYSVNRIKSRIGSDSTGRSSRFHGMGLVVRDTLPPRARRELQRGRSTLRETIPFRVNVYPRVTYLAPASGVERWHKLLEPLRRLPGMATLGTRKVRDWVFEDFSTRMVTPGNIITLGGIQRGGRLDENHPQAAPTAEQRPALRWRYLNSGVKNILKVLIGFIPAFATFALTKQWWLLAYGGAFIWFGITGLRNVLQSVLGGGGLRRSPLLRWNDYVSWARLTDSLLFTGFSVPLLDLLVKTVVLDHGLGITTASSPVMLYTIMALANGVYLCTHNALRGFTRGVIAGNFFRSVLSIPIAVGLNAMLSLALGAAGVTGVAMALQKWAAIISKAASDLVAGIIEGLGDRYNNIRARSRGYHDKLTQLLNAYAQLELMYPDMRVMALLEDPQRLSCAPNAEARDLLKIIIINALDLLYFWMYQPRARSALKRTLAQLSPEERQILLQSQKTLRLFREISQLFVDGMIGKNFSKALSFYLNHYESYLQAMEEMTRDAEGPATG